MPILPKIVSALNLHCKSESSVLTKGQLLTAFCTKFNDHTGQHHGSVMINLQSIDIWWDQR